MFGKRTTQFVGLDQGHVCPILSGEECRTEPNGASPNHQGSLALRDAAALDRMCANTEGFNKGQLLERQGGRAVEQSKRNRHEILHPTVAMDTQYLQTLTAVSATLAACSALATVDIGI